MAPQPPLFPPAAFKRRGGLPPCEPSRFSSNPAFDHGFARAAHDGDLRRVKRAARMVGRGTECRRLAEKLAAVRDGHGIGLLHAATFGGSLPMCRYQVEDLQMDIDDAGPLGSCEMVELLLSKGAYVDAVNLGGTALHLAAHYGLDDIMKHKIALGGSGYTALFLATVVGSLKCVKLLLEAGADVDGNCKETPLMIATTAGSTDILKCLVLAGADANIPDNLGRVPIEIAAHSGRREDVEILFPVTSRIPSVRDWSVDGIISHVKSACPANV